MLSRFALLSPLALALLAASAGCRNAESFDGPGIRVGFFPNLTHAAALVGLESGRFQSALGEQSPIDARGFSAGTELVTAIAAGEIDIAYMGPGPAIKAFTAGVPIRVLSGASSGGSVIVSRADLPLSGVASLSGRRVTVPRYGNTQDVLMRALLREAGLKDTAHGGTVEVMQAESGDVRMLLEQRQIDAAILPEPWAARMQVETKARVVVDWREVWRGGDYPSTLLVARESLLRRRPDVAAKWLKAHREVVNWMRSHPVEARKVANDALFHHTRKRLRSEVIDLAFTRLKITDEIEATVRTSAAPPPVLTEFAALMRDIGYLRDPVVLSGITRPISMESPQ